MFLAHCSSLSLSKIFTNTWKRPSKNLYWQNSGNLNDTNSKKAFGSWRFVGIAGALVLLMSAGQIQGLATGGDAAVGCGTPPEETVEQSEAPTALSAKDAVAAGCNCSDQFVNIKTWCGRNSKQNAKGDGVTDDGPAIQSLEAYIL